MVLSEIPAIQGKFVHNLRQICTTLPPPRKRPLRVAGHEVEQRC